MNIENLKRILGNKIMDVTQHNEKRIYATVKKQDIKDVVKKVFTEMEGRYIIASGVENFDSFEILYHFGFDETGTVVSFRVFLDKENPEIESLTAIIPGIAWIERETWELLGINFTGHPKLKHFLLKKDWPEGNYPLRKEKNEK
jgi:Ni,Fe-hydrogenase III component G